MFTLSVNLTVGGLSMDDKKILNTEQENIELVQAELDYALSDMQNAPISLILHTIMDVLDNAGRRNRLTSQEREVVYMHLQDVYGYRFSALDHTSGTSIDTPMDMDEENLELVKAELDYFLCQDLREVPVQHIVRTALNILNKAESEQRLTPKECMVACNYIARVYGYTF